MPTLPPSDTGSFRRLGRAQRPTTGSAVLALFGLLVLVAVPLYLWRRPRAAAVPDQGHADAGPAASESAQPPATALDPRLLAPKVGLAPARTVRCGSRSGRAAKDHCDDLPSVAEALARAIRDNVACAPPSAAPYSVSFVLSVDFDRKRAHLWAGRSGTLKRRAASDLVQCVEHSMAPPDWVSTPHQFVRYEVNVVASYPSSGATGYSGSLPVLPATASPTGAGALVPRGSPAPLGGP